LVAICIGFSKNIQHIYCIFAPRNQRVDIFINQHKLIDYE